MKHREHVSFSLDLLKWSGIESDSTSHLVAQARTLSLTDSFLTSSKTLSRYVLCESPIKRLDLSLQILMPNI